METIALIFLLIVGYFIPRTIGLSVVASVGLMSWYIAGPLLILALITDLVTIEEIKKCLAQDWADTKSVPVPKIPNN